MCYKSHLAFAVGTLMLAAFACSSYGGTTTALFNFENQEATAGGALTTLTLTNGELSVTIDRGGQPFDIANLSSFNGTSAFGARSIAPTPPGMNRFIVNFSQPVSSFSAQMGDFSGTLTDQLVLTAFSGPNGTGQSLGITHDSLVLNNASTMGFKTVTIGGSGIKSVQMIGGDALGSNSVFYDNLSATFTPGSSNGGGGNSVPLPAAALVAPVGAAMAWMAARKARRGHLRAS